MLRFSHLAFINLRRRIFVGFWLPLQKGTICQSHIQKTTLDWTD